MSIVRSNGSNIILMSIVNIRRPSVVTADHAFPVREKNAAGKTFSSHKMANVPVGENCKHFVLISGRVFREL